MQRIAISEFWVQLGSAAQFFENLFRPFLNCLVVH